MLEKVKAIPIPKVFMRGMEFTRVTAIHDGAIAAHLEGGVDEENITGTLLIFATKPSLRLIHHAKIPDDIICDYAYTFGLGEMWISGIVCKDEVSNLYHLGSRRDKRTFKRQRLEVKSNAFFAASAGDVDRAVSILRTNRIPIGTSCSLSGFTILHYAVSANNLHAVRRLVLHYKMPVDTIGYFSFCPINVAVRFDFDDIVDFLASQGAEGSSWAPVKWMYPRDKDDLKMLQQLAEKDLTKCA
jgi:hypothetical protein